MKMDPMWHALVWCFDGFLGVEASAMAWRVSEAYWRMFEESILS